MANQIVITEWHFHREFFGEIEKVGDYPFSPAA
jgi:hypothetical protein